MSNLKNSLAYAINENVFGKPVVIKFINLFIKEQNEESYDLAISALDASNSLCKTYALELGLSESRILATLIGTYNILTNTSSMSTDSPISLSEASMAYTKKFWERRGFDDLCVRGEHKYFTENRFEQILDIPYSFILIAINHRNNMTNELRGDDCLLKFSENNEKFGEVANFFDTWDMDTQMFIIELRKYIL